MKRIVARIILVGVSVAACALMLNSCWVRIHAIERFECSFDAKISQEIQKQISANLSAHTGAKSDEIVSSLLEQFPCIAHVDLHIQPNKDALITLIAQAPLVRVNDDHVLTQSARLIPLHDFDPSAIFNLAHINVAQGAVCSAHELAELQRCIKQVSPALLNRYEVHWRTSHEVVLSKAHDSLVQFVCCAHQLTDQKLIEQYVKEVAYLLAERTSVDLKKLWVADVRFENQLILRASAMKKLGKIVMNEIKGGIQDGTCVS